jgi:predicted 2-oxoglutarate/Fe(II)-dependent dioxygenase YbiX
MTGIDLLQTDDVLSDASLDRIRREMRAAPGDPATVLGSTPETRVTSTARRAAQVTVQPVVRTLVVTLLEQLQPRIEAHFERALDSVEEPQFIRYGPGDYFVAHQDGNTPLIHDDSRFRKVTAVIFISAPETFSGGELVLHGPEPPLTLSPAPGRLVAFPAETTHEVLPITRGERLSIASWYRG